MKKLFLVLTFVSAVSITFAQDLTSKKGVNILPEPGEWAIGIDAVPFLEYAGNIFNGTDGNDAPSWGYPNNMMMIQGLLVKEGGKRYRAKVRLGFGSDKQETGDTATGSATEFKNNYNYIGLGAGIQQSRGKGRVQGKYGAEAMLHFAGGKTETSFNGDPSTGATLEIKDGSMFGISVNGFIGVEYFFAPKMSLCGEFGWGLMFESTGEEETTTYDPDGNVTTVTQGKSNEFYLDNSGTSSGSSFGSLILSFYF
jgi:hypothetical protein